MSNIKLFESKQVRSTWSEAEDKWYFSVQDVVEILTDTVDAKDYIKKMKKRDTELNFNWGTICPPVEMTAADGKKRKIQAADLKGILRIIQSIPSPKAESLIINSAGQHPVEMISHPVYLAESLKFIRSRPFRANVNIRHRVAGRCPALMIYEPSAQRTTTNEIADSLINDSARQRPVEMITRLVYQAESLIINSAGQRPVKRITHVIPKPQRGVINLAN
jgi:hypothetical protein